MANLIEGIQTEQTRVRELLKEYEAIGTAGLFGATMIKQSLVKADKAIATGDAVAMLLAYSDLKEIE